MIESWDLFWFTGNMFNIEKFDCRYLVVCLIKIYNFNLIQLMTWIWYYHIGGCGKNCQVNVQDKLIKTT